MVLILEVLSIHLSIHILNEKVQESTEKKRKERKVIDCDDIAFK